MKTDITVLRAVAKAVKEIDKIGTPDISGMDTFYIDTARDLLLKIIHSNGYKLSEKGQRLVKK